MPFWTGQSSLTALQWIARAATAYGFLLLMTKLMGQREMGQLTLFDFVSAVTVGSITGGFLSSSETTLVAYVSAVAALASIHILISIVSLKAPRLRRVVQEEPLVLVQNGQILEDTMRKTRINLDDLMIQLRQRNYPNLADVEFAILETNGQISVIPKSQARPVTPRDLRLPTSYEGLPTVLVQDGDVLQDNLKENQLTKEWLEEELKEYGITDISEVLAAVLDTQGRLYVSKKDQTNDDFWN
ncbi:MAG: DUF421 domain-containing protein [Firmicutes bacterium]|nr:DUF421 domain-containing protein [Bacillota bacterium]